MEPTINERFAELLEGILAAIKKRTNSAIFKVTTCGSLYYGWNLADFQISDFWLKALASLFAIFFAPAIATFLKEFMHDLYQLKIKPRIFKNKK